MTPISQEEFRAMNERAQRKADVQRAAIAAECSTLAPYTAEQLENTPYTGRDAILCVDTHEQADAYGKANGLTVTFAAWHPNPEYRIFKTGSLLSRNDEYPSGLILVDDKGKPYRYKI